jgi:hypothetical protein
MSTQTSTFDTTAFATAVQQRDADALLAAYADDAVITLLDRDHPPASPTTYTGRAEIEQYLRDVCAREMEHDVPRIVSNADVLAFEERCRYPDGVGVCCIATAELDDGRIVRQTGVQVWD